MLSLYFRRSTASEEHSFEEAPPKVSANSAQTSRKSSQFSPTLPHPNCTTSTCRPGRIPEHREYRELDQRRNLYVLGLPYSLKTVELEERFSPHGHVSHVVILATVDSASRRRGFVVMSSHREALAAINALNGTQIHDQTINVSWAVVQRSHGFMDGADRLAMIEAHATSHSQQAEPCTPQLAAPPRCLQFSTSTLFISNLPALLFSHVSDLYPLLCPYGDIDKLEILNSSSASSSEKRTVSAIVEFRSSSSAQEALSSLDRQVYADQVIRIRQISTPESANPESSASQVMQPQQVSPLFDSLHQQPSPQTLSFASAISTILPRKQAPYSVQALSGMPLQSLMNHVPFYAPPHYPPSFYSHSYPPRPPALHSFAPLNPCVFMNQFNPTSLVAWGQV